MTQAGDTASSLTSWTPRRAGLLAAAIFIAAALTLCWPVLQGHVMAGDDYYLAGWAFRRFGAEYWRAHHAIPLWNPFIFGGMPYVAGMHGDIFYPTAWLRYFLPLDVATNLTFGGHLVIAGLAMYAFLRGLGTSWVAAVTGGLAYELSGIVASQISPGHDGKLFVAAMSPFLFLGLLRGIRDRKLTGYAAAALSVGLALHGHPQSGYYLLVAAGLWTLYLVFRDPAGPKGSERWRALGVSAAMALLGFGLYAIQLLPFYAYIPFSPRGEGGPSGGWEYATSYALPTAELFSTFLPELSGFRDTYSGANYPIKTHTEYLGPVVIILALCGVGGQRNRRLQLALGGIGLLFLLVALGGHTPFYRLWYELMPMMKKVRAAGMAFFLPALVVSAFAGLGVDRILRGEVAARRMVIGAGFFALFGLLGAAGGLDGIAMALSLPEAVQIAVQAAPELHAGALRLFMVATVGGATLYAIRTSRLRGFSAAAMLFLVVTADLWSLDRKFFVFNGTAETLFGDDQITSAMRKSPLPFRVWDPKGAVGELEVYPGSWLMGRDIPQLLGYHGQELNTFDQLMGGKGVWSNQLSVPLLELFAVRYVVLRQAQKLPGFHQVLGPVSSTPGRPGILYEADTIPPYVRLMAGAVKAPEGQVAEVVADARFPLLTVAIYADSEKVTPAPTADQLRPVPATATARVTFWEAGKMRIAIEGRDERPLYLVVAENWYKDWRATVDGAAVPVLRAQHTLLSVTVPPGAREVAFEFRSPEYERGRLITLLSVAAVAGLFLVPVVRRRSPRDA